MKEYELVNTSRTSLDLESMEITTMQNELTRIGILIFDLRRGIAFEPGKSNFDFLTEEFRRITLSLGYQWSEKIPGFPYLLEFHRIEATRLMEAVYQLDGVQFALMETSLHSKFLHEVHTELIMHFADLIANIDKMTGTSNITSRPFDLN
jgi:hypothetical protein